MRRIKVLVVALMAVFALCALAASSASAVPPLCLQVDIEKTGNFANSLCEGSPQHGQEWVLAKIRDRLNSWPARLWCALVDPGFTSQVLGWTALEECLEGDAADIVTNALWTRVKNVRGLAPGIIHGNCGCGAVLYLYPGEAGKATTKNLGDFTLKPKGTGPTTLCTGLSGPTLLLGGAPATGETTIEFSGCTATGSGGSGTCDALGLGQTPGNITANAKDELVYIGTKGEAENEEGQLGDLFTPANGGTTFVTLIYAALSGGTCPTGSVLTAVEGSVIGLVEPDNTVTKQVMLTFPSTAISEAWQWLSEGKVHLVTSKLKAFGLTATEIGLADIELEGGTEWGLIPD